MAPCPGPSRRPRRNPPNPFLEPDVEAEKAVCATFFIFDFCGNKPTQFKLESSAPLRLHPDYVSPYRQEAVARIKAAMRMMAERGALEVPSDSLKACLLHGDSLHPKTREYLRLPHLGLLPEQF